MSQKYDQWRYVSIITNLCSYDFILTSIEDCIDLIIAVNEAVGKINGYDHKKKIQKIQKQKPSFDITTINGKIQQSMKEKYDLELVVKENRFFEQKI